MRVSFTLNQSFCIAKSIHNIYNKNENVHSDVEASINLLDNYMEEYGGVCSSVPFSYG